MGNSYNFRVGMQPAGYNPPAGIPREGFEGFKWYFEQLVRLGCKASTFGGQYLSDNDPGLVKEMAAMGREKDIAWVMQAGRGFDITSFTADGEALKKTIEAGKVLGSDIFTFGYGRLNLETSRYNRAFPYAEQAKKLIAMFKNVIPLFEDAGVYLALENHCDFTGEEIVNIVDGVNSPNMKCQLDVGNGCSVFTDPMKDIEVMAPYTLSCHVKDFSVKGVEDWQWPNFFLTLQGCRLGEGIIDFDVLMKQLIEKAPRNRDIPMLAEQAFIPTPAGMDAQQYERESTEQFITFMQDLVERY